MIKRTANPYFSAPNGVVQNMQVGQWIRLEGYAKPGRFVRYNSDGSAYIVKPNGKGKRARVSLAAFRLAVGKSVHNVLPIIV